MEKLAQTRLGSLVRSMLEILENSCISEGDSKFMMLLSKGQLTESKAQDSQLTKSELRGLVLGLKDFQSTLSPAQQSALAKTLDPSIVMPSSDEIAGLFGDLLTERELQDFLVSKADHDPHAMVNLSTLAACVVSIIVDC